ESIGGLIGGIILVGVACLVIYEAALRLIEGVGLNAGLELAGFIAIGYTFATDVVRVTIFRKASASESSTVKVGFYHAVADLSSTLIAFLGFGLAIIGFNQGDAAASIVLGVLLSVLSIKLVRSNVMELSDTASRELVQKIKSELLAFEGIQKCTELKARKAGDKLFVEAAVQVSNSLSLEEAHELVSKLEAKLAGVFGNINATIHMEPSEKEVMMRRLVERLATVDGVREVHDVAAVYVGGKLYITLHAYVDPALPMGKAHEIAEKIEKQMHAGIKLLENVTVHLEPYGADVQVREVDEKEIEKIIQEAARRVEGDLHVKNVVTYVVEGKRYISLDCCFAMQVSIIEAHDVASRIEAEIKGRFADAVVTVHVEPYCT
ncbi:MAG: cation diffusion facilitator family transporter, partial [Candidatus Bathyarchaeia archaeon]